VLGGRAIHPINIAVGGFHRAPRQDDLLKLLPDLEWGIQAAMETTRWVAQLDFPDFERPYEMVALQHPDEYPMNEGAVASTSGKVVDVVDYEQHYEERHVEHSTALHSVQVPSGRSYHVGPLARLNLNLEQLTPRARQIAESLNIDWPCWNPFQAIVARGIEIIHAYEEAVDIIQNYRPFHPSKISYNYQSGSGCAATEAPRGLIYHRYEVNDDGQVTFAKIVPPTSQNQQQIEDDLNDWLPRLLTQDEEQIGYECERLIRCYDPCISCSTHFLKVKIVRHPEEHETCSE